MANSAIIETNEGPGSKAPSSSEVPSSVTSSPSTLTVNEI
ncbi:uncharacterized protein METZ01_LOCUS342825 [marine metagenome]|uniref:Uncharacterized protein n=1 Tax=marine metagenome TaxID=408172 RepID=A0A382R049_9ZZZZ